MLNIIVNPATGSGRGSKVFKKIKPLLDEAGVKYKVHFSGENRSIEEIVASLTRQKESIDAVDASDRAFSK